MANDMVVSLKLRDELSKKLTAAREKVKSFARSVDKMFNKLVNLRNLAIATTIIMLGKATVGTAAKFEVFERQLQLVTETAKEANDAFLAIREFARTSPLETEDVTQSFVRLRAVGMEPTIEQMKTLGGVAVLFDREMTEVLDSFIGLNKRTLRALGVEIDRTGSKAIIASGNIRKEVTKDSASIREALLEIWEERFPNAIERAADTTKAKIAIMKSNITELSVVIGDTLKPAVDVVVEAVGNLANEWRELLEAVKAQKEIKKGLNDTNDALEKGIELTVEKKRLEGLLAEAIKNNQKSVQVFEGRRATSIASLERMIARLQARIKNLNEEFQETAKSIVKGVPGLEGSGKLGAEGDKDGDGKKKAIASAAQFAVDFALKASKRAAKEQEKEASKRSKAEKKALEEFRDFMVEDAQWHFEHKINKAKTEKEIADEARRLEIMSIRDDFKRQKELINFEMNQRIESQREMLNNGLITHKNFEDSKTNITKEAALERTKIEELEKEKRISFAKNIASTVGNLAKQSVRNSKIASKKKQNILAGIAIAEGAAAAVSGIKSVWQEDGLSIYAKIALSALTAAGIVAATASQVSSIKNQSFARGTGFAPGGTSLVGEEGPELVNLPRGAQVRTSVQTRQIMGSNNFNPTIVIQGDATEKTVRDIGSKLSEFAETMEQAIRNNNLDLNRMGIATV